MSFTQACIVAVSLTDNCWAIHISPSAQCCHQGRTVKIMYQVLVIIWFNLLPILLF